MTYEIKSMPKAYPQLYPYQKEGIRFALDHERCLIADEMGLGKTVQAIGVLNHDSFITSVLIICTKSLIANWLRELEQWMLPERLDYLRSKMVVTNYEQLKHVEGRSFHTIIVDEAHTIKARGSRDMKQSKRTEAVMALCRSAKRLIFLTGTPMPNRPIELWTFLTILDPEQWGTTKEDMHRFAKRYCAAQRTVINWGNFKQQNTGGMAWDYSGASNLAELNEKLFSSFVIRREKSEVLSQLPPKTRELVLTPLIDQDFDLERDLGEITEENYENQIAKLKANRVLFTEWSRRRHQQGLEKIDFAAEYIESRLNESPKIIVFAYHEDVIRGLSDAFRKAHIEHALIVGSQNIDQRARSVYQFQTNPKCRIIIGSLHAMGVGLTLTASSHVIFVEQDPVPATMQQGEDRAHRIGQTENVHVEWLITDGSLDARICQILVKKMNVIRQVIGG